MYPNLLKLVTSVSSLLGVSSSAAELLLQEYKWNQEQLVSSYFLNPEDALIRAHAKINPKDANAASSTSPGSESCFICMEDFSEANGPTYSLSCGHAFHRYVRKDIAVNS
jgi:hypothetical protein